MGMGLGVWGAAVLHPYKGFASSTIWLLEQSARRHAALFFGYV
jgi:hypothetical protein